MLTILIYIIICDDLTILYSKCGLILTTNISYAKFMPIGRARDREHFYVRIKHRIFVPSVDLEQMFQRIDIADDDLIHESNDQVL